MVLYIVLHLVNTTRYHLMLSYVVFIYGIVWLVVLYRIVLCYMMSLELTHITARAGFSEFAMRSLPKALLEGLSPKSFQLSPLRQLFWASLMVFRFKHGC